MDNLLQEIENGSRTLNARELADLLISQEEKNFYEQHKPQNLDNLDLESQSHLLQYRHPLGEYAKSEEQSVRKAPFELADVIFQLNHGY